MALSAAEHKPEPFTAFQRFQLTVLYADSLYQTRQFIQAEKLFQKALPILAKNLPKMKTNSVKISESKKEHSDVEIKFKIYKCCMALERYNAAKEILESVPFKRRTAKINMALANLYRDTGNKRTSALRYKDVLQECPLAIEAAENLLKLGVKGIEVNSLMVQVTSEINWLSQWLKTQAQLYSNDFTNALNSYKGLNWCVFSNNTTVLVDMAYCYHYLCEDSNAIQTLQRALRIDENLRSGKDLLATLLVSSGSQEHISYLENLTPSQPMALWTDEDWIVFGNYMFATKKFDKAVFFGQQALLESRNIEALLLKSKTFLEVCKYEDAVHHCSVALQFCPHRFDLYQCLVDCYVKMNRLKEAETVAHNACKQLNYSAQAITVSMSNPLHENTE